MTFICQPLRCWELRPKRHRRDIFTAISIPGFNCALSMVRRYRSSRAGSDVELGIHKLRALGNVAGTIAAAPSIAAAAKALGVDRSSVHRWVTAGKVPRPGGSRRPATAPGPDQSPDARVPIEVLIADSLADTAPLTSEQRTVWRASQRDIATAAQGADYDIRSVLTLEGAALTHWKARRAEWLRTFLAGDARVERPSGDCAWRARRSRHARVASATA